jgi:pilus assembly protein CpaB
MKSRAIIPLIVGLAVGGVAIKCFLTVLKKAKGSNVSDTVEVIRASTDIAPTVEIAEAMLSKASVPKALVPEGSFSDAKKIVGRVSSQMIPKGMPVTNSLLAPEGTPPGMVARIQDGYRAVAIQVDEVVGVGGFVKPGSHVDVVIVMSGASKNQNISRVILQNVEVLAAGGKTDSGGQGASVSRSVTLLVKPEDASKLSLAAQKGKLRLTMRSQDDRREPKAVTLTDEDLLTDGAPSRNKGQGEGSVFDRLFGNLSKVTNAPVDTTAGSQVAPAPAPQEKEWVVEVLSGAEVYQVKFDAEGRNMEQVPAQSHTAGKTRSPGKASSIAVPGGAQGSAGNSITATTPMPFGQKAGGPEQDAASGAPEKDGE